MRTLRQSAAALRLLIIFTVIIGVGYTAVVTGLAQIPGLRSSADGSLVHNAAGTVVGSSLIGQNFTDKNGNPLAQYFQSRPSEAGDGYDPTASSASNLGPESIVDVLPNPKDLKDDPGKQSLLTQVCARSLAVGQFNGVSGARPFCTASGVGAVLAVFYRGPGFTGAVTRVVSINEACPTTPFLATYDGVTVSCAVYGQDYSLGKIVPIKGSAHAVVPSDAVTASGSGLDPDISPAYAVLQEARIAKTRGITVADVAALVAKHTVGRALGFIGQPVVDVLDLNIALDAQYPEPQSAQK